MATFYTYGEHSYATAQAASAARAADIEAGHGAASDVQEWTEEQAYGIAADTRGVEVLAEQRNSLIDFDGRETRRPTRAPKVGRRYRMRLR